MLSYNPSVTSGDSSPYTGEPSVAVLILMLVLKLMTLNPKSPLVPLRKQTYEQKSPNWLKALHQQKALCSSKEIGPAHPQTSGALQSNAGSGASKGTFWNLSLSGLPSALCSTRLSSISKSSIV